LAKADQLVAAVLPLSRSPAVGQTATAFATVINSSGQPVSGCTVSLSNFSGTFAYQTTNPSTNALTGTRNQPFSMSAGGSQTLIVFLTPSTSIASTDELLVFQCSGTTAAASIIGVDTLLISVGATQPPDIVALVATPTNDGIVRMSGTSSPAAFAMATVNVGATGTVTLSADTGDIQLPLQTQICQTNPSTGACLAAPASSVTLSISQGATPTFSIFTTATSGIPFFPSNVRLFLRFKDGGGVTRGSTSVALTSSPTLAGGQTAGGFYTGIYRVTSGPLLGRFGTAELIVSEDGEMKGVTIDPATTSTVSSLFTAQAIPNSTLQYSFAGTIYAATGYVLASGGTVSPIAIAGAVSPKSFIAGTFSLSGESGEYYAAYQASVYERASSLSLLSGTWTIRSVSNGSAVGTLQVGSLGTFTGSDISGCIYSGTISTISSAYNAYRINLSVSNCGLYSGAYEGLGGLFDGHSYEDSFQFELSSSSYIQTNYITRY
jgi:hypothetical protein